MEGQQKTGQKKNDNEEGMRMKQERRKEEAAGK